MVTIIAHTDLSGSVLESADSSADLSTHSYSTGAFKSPIPTANLSYQEDRRGVIILAVMRLLVCLCMTN